MKLTSTSFERGGPIPARCAFAQSDPESHARLAGNRSPQLAWSDVPEGVRSFVLTCIDVDVPTVGDDVNQEGRTVSADLPRTEFVHLLAADIPGSVTSLEEGTLSDGVVAGGKSDPPGPRGSRQGVNDYTSWFAGDAEMGGTYLGYDGPGPPWNDERLHHYHFRVHALDVTTLDLPDAFTRADLERAMAGHVLASAELVGTYTTNPAVSS